MKHLITTLAFIVLFGANLLAQSSNSAYINYIEQYKSLAIDQMQRYGIPASITLAQGLLESAAGQSMLATKANNHFGIKVGSDWNGPYVLRDDDKPNERFRQYNHAGESFEDHSKFLQKPRYQPLFQLAPTDYAGWARTLKQCGYATSPTYAESLIGIIERYNLAQYDYANNVASTTMLPPVQYGVALVVPQSYGVNTMMTPEEQYFAQHPVQRRNKVYYIKALPGESLRAISKGTSLRYRRLRKWNDLPRKCTIGAGDVIYLSSKRKHADKVFQGTVHVVQPGESMYSIAQRYAIKMSSLYKMNKLPKEYQPQMGDRLRIY